MGYFNNNSKSRTALDMRVKRTIKFKTLYPDVLKFKEALTDYGIPTTDPDIDFLFAFLEAMMSNTWLKFTTEDKNKAFLAWSWKKYYLLYTREKLLQNKTLEEMNAAKTTGEQKLFRVNRTALGTLEAKFLDSGTSQDQSFSGSLLTQLDLLDEWNAKADPQIKFLQNLSLAISLPLQPDKHGRIY